MKQSTLEAPGEVFAKQAPDSAGGGEHLSRLPILTDSGLHSAVLALLVLACFARILGGYFSGADFSLVARLAQIFQGHGQMLTGGLAAGTTGNTWAYSLTVIPVLLDYLLWRANAFGYLLGNLICFSAAIVLMYATIKQLTLSWSLERSSLAAFFSAALFAASPIHSQSIATAVGRADLWSGLFCLAGVYLWLKRRDGWKWNVVFSIVSFCLAASFTAANIGLALPLSSPFIQPSLGQVVEALAFPLPSYAHVPSYLATILIAAYVVLAAVIGLKLLSGEISWRWPLFLAIWILAAAIPLCAYPSLATDSEGGRLAVLVTIPLSAILPLLAFHPPSGQYSASLDVRLIGISIAALLLITFVSYRSANAATVHWLHAGREARQLISMSISLANEHPAPTKCLLAGIPRWVDGIDLFADQRTMQFMFSPPFVPIDTASRLIAIAPVAFAKPVDGELALVQDRSQQRFGDRCNDPLNGRPNNQLDIPSVYPSNAVSKGQLQAQLQKKLQQPLQDQLKEHLRDPEVKGPFIWCGGRVGFRQLEPKKSAPPPEISPAAPPSERFKPQIFTNALLRDIHPSLTFTARDRKSAKIWQKELRRTLTALVGGFPEKRCPLYAQITDVRHMVTYKPDGQAVSYTREKIVFNSRPDLPVFAYFLKPLSAPLHKRLPCIVCLPGHGTMDDIVGVRRDHTVRKEWQQYQLDFPLQCVANGYPALVIEQLAFGTRRGSDIEKMDDTNCGQPSQSAILMGKTMIGWRIWDTMRAIDYLATRNDVDMKRLALMGVSAGGTTSLYTAALDSRVKCIVLVCSLNTFKDSLMSHGHCVCNLVPGIARVCEMYDIGGLLAPRPLFSEAAVKDVGFPLAGALTAFDKIKKIYRVFHAGDKVQLQVIVGKHGFSGTQVFGFLKNQL